MNRQKKALFLNLSTVVLLGSVVLLASCSAFGVRSDTGTVTVTLGGSSSAKALGDTTVFYSAATAGSGGLPVLSSVTLSVSGPDMAAVSKTVYPGSDIPDSISLSLDVPVGSDRRVELYVVPDWDATALIYSNSSMPTLVKAYGGSSTVNVSSSGTTNVAITLGVAETKILLPNPGGNTSMYVADSIDGESSDAAITIDSVTDHFQFDRFGRLLMTQADSGATPTFGMYTDTTHDTVTTNYTHQCPFAYYKAANCVYFANGSSLYYCPITAAAGDNADIAITLPGNISFTYMPAVAIDSDGYIYLAGYSYTGDEPTGALLLKLYVDLSNDYTATLIDYASYASLGLSAVSPDSELYPILDVTDMTIQDGKLYIAAGEHLPNSDGDSIHRGKIVEVDLDDLSKVREIGWTDSNLPTDTSAQFYGPTRFLAIVPHKLVVSDEGYASGEINRVVKVDLDDWSFDETGLDNAVSFFETYNY